MLVLTTSVRNYDDRLDTNVKTKRCLFFRPEVVNRWVLVCVVGLVLVLLFCVVLVFVV